MVNEFPPFVDQNKHNQNGTWRFVSEFIRKMKRAIDVEKIKMLIIHKISPYNVQLKCNISYASLHEIMQQFSERSAK